MKLQFCLFFFLLLGFSLPSCITQKQYGISKQSAHKTTTLVSEICLSSVRAACELALHGELWLLTYIPDSVFSIRHFVCTYMYNSKTTGGIKTFYTLNNCSTIEDIYLGLELYCEIWSVSYESKHTSQPLFNTTFVSTYTHNSKTTDFIQTFYISNNCFTIIDV